MRYQHVILWWAAAIVVVTAEEATTTATAVETKDDQKDQVAAPSDLDNGYLDLGSVSSGLLSLDSWTPIVGPSSQAIPDSGAEADVKTVTLTKQVPVPYPVTVEKRVPVTIEVPVDKPYPVYVPRPYHVVVEKKVPYHVGVPVPQPYTVERHVPVPVKVPVDKPVPVPVPHPYPVLMYRKVPYTIERHVPYPVKVPYIRPYPVHVPVEKHVPVPVEKVVPYPVHVPVERPVPVHVEKPVPYPVEKLVPYPVEKIVHVPYKVPIKVPVKVPVHLPITSHQHSHHSSGTNTNELYSDPSQQHYHFHQVDETREDAEVHPQASGDDHSPVYAQAGAWGVGKHHGDASETHYDGYVRFSQDHEGAAAGSNLIHQDQDHVFHNVGSTIRVAQGQGVQYNHGGVQDPHGQYSTGHVQSQGEEGQQIAQAQNQYNHQPLNQTYHYQRQQQHVHGDNTPANQHRHRHGNIRAHQHHQGVSQAQAHHPAGKASRSEIAKSEKRFKDGRQDSYSKVNLGPTAFTVQHG